MNLVQGNCWAVGLETLPIQLRILCAFELVPLQRTLQITLPPWEEEQEASGQSAGCVFTHMGSRF